MEGISLVDVTYPSFRLLSAFALALVVGCSSGPPAPPETEANTYIERMQAKRTQKDAYFRDSTDTDNPFVTLRMDQRQALLPLSYFPVNPQYSVPASLNVAGEQPVYDMPTSTGTQRKMRKVGTLEFTLNGAPLTLGAFVPASEPDLKSLFVPFSDLTTGVSTYEAGRYLDIDRTMTGLYVIDFNNAYNPYCAYNPTYECPFPPPSNRMKVAIEAGERTKTAPGATAGTPAS